MIVSSVSVIIIEHKKNFMFIIKESRKSKHLIMLLIFGLLIIVRYQFSSLSHSTIKFYYCPSVKLAVDSNFILSPDSGFELSGRPERVHTLVDACALTKNLANEKSRHTQFWA